MCVYVRVSRTNKTPAPPLSQCSALHLQKRPAYPHQSPTDPQKSPIFLQKSITYPTKSATYPQALYFRTFWPITQKPRNIRSAPVLTLLSFTSNNSVSPSSMRIARKPSAEVLCTRTVDWINRQEEGGGSSSARLEVCKPSMHFIH